MSRFGAGKTDDDSGGGLFGSFFGGGDNNKGGDKGGSSALEATLDVAVPEGCPSGVYLYGVSC